MSPLQTTWGNDKPSIVAENVSDNTKLRT